MPPDTDLPVIPSDAKPGDVFPPSNKVLGQLGFRGMRRVEINIFARPFVEDGIIDRYPEDMAMTPLISLMENYMMQGKFGDDPFGRNTAQDDVDALKKKLAESDERLARLEAAIDRQLNPAPEIETELPPVASVVDDIASLADIPADPTPPDKPEKPGTKAMREYRELQKKAKALGIETWRKKRVVLIAEIEEAEARGAKPADGD